MKKNKNIDLLLRVTEYILDGKVHSTYYSDIEKALKRKVFDLNDSLYNNIKSLSKSNDLNQEQLLHIRELLTKYNNNYMFYIPIINILFSDDLKFYNQNRLLNIAGEEGTFDSIIIESKIYTIISIISCNLRANNLSFRFSDRLWQFLEHLENKDMDISKNRDITNTVQKLIDELNKGNINNETTKSITKLIVILYKNHYLDANQDTNSIIIFIRSSIFNNLYKSALSMIQSINNNAIILEIINMIYELFIQLKNDDSFTIIKRSFYYFIRNLTILFVDNPYVDVWKLEKILEEIETSKQKKLQ